MSTTATALREIHRIHRSITDLKGRLQRGPLMVAGAKGDLQQLSGKMEAAKEALKQSRMAADERQLQLRQREDRIKDLQGKLNSCASNREYQTLKEQIAADDQANSVLSDEILEILERIDQQQLTAEQVEQQHQLAEKNYDELKARIEQEQKQLESELERFGGELRQAETALPSEIKADYHRISRVRGEDTLAQVENETCSGCYQTLSPQTMNVLLLGKTIFCTSCGALLYLNEVD